MEAVFDKKKLLPIVKEFAEIKHGKTISKIKYIGGGSFGRVFEVEFEDGCIEIIKVFMFVDMLKSEAKVLSLLRTVSPIKIPIVYYTHLATDKNPIDVIAMEKIEGKTTLNIPFLLFSTKNKRRIFAEIVIDALIKIHQVTNDKFGFIRGATCEERFDTWKEFYFRFANDIFEKAKVAHSEGKLDNAFYVLLKKGMENFDYIIDDDVGKPTLVHGDFHLGNILIDKKTSLPTGIIDPLNSMWGDREYDIFHLRAIFDNRFQLYKTYKEKVNTSAKVDLKCAFYALVHEVMCHLRPHKYSKYVYRVVRRNVEEQFRLHQL